MEPIKEFLVRFLYMFKYIHLSDPNCVLINLIAQSSPLPPVLFIIHFILLLQGIGEIPPDSHWFQLTKVKKKSTSINKLLLSQPRNLYSLFILLCI